MQCNSCGNTINFRIGIGLADEEKFVCQCPYCAVALRGVLRLDQKAGKSKLESEDITDLHKDSVEGESTLRGVNIYTDLPVHRSCQGKSLAEGGSAFMQLWEFMGDRFPEYQSRAHLLHEFRLLVLPSIRRTASLYVAENWQDLGRSLKELKLSDISGAAGQHPAYAFQRLFDSLYVPILDPDIRIPLTDELLVNLNACTQRHKEVFAAFLTRLFEQHGFGQFRRQVVETTAKCFSKFDALVPALAYEHFTKEWAKRLDDFQIFRDDFDELKSLYVDVFELASRSLVYTGGISNLANRGSVTQWLDGKHRELTPFLKARAVDREFVLNELPRLKALYDSIKRHTRNDIGHFKMYYDFATCCLIDEKGGKENFILFLQDFLCAVRLTAYLVTLAEKVTLYRERLIAHEPIR